MKKNLRINLIISVLITILSLSILLAFTSGGIFSAPIRLASIFMLFIALAILFVKGVIVNESILGAANITTSILHITAVLLSSIAFCRLLPSMLKTYLALNVSLICLVLIIDVLLMHFDTHSKIVNDNLDVNRNVFNTCVEKASNIYIMYGDSQYSSALNRLLEELKYSDNSCLCGDEPEIISRLDELNKLLSDSLASDGDNAKNSTGGEAVTNNEILDSDSSVINKKIEDLIKLVKLRNLKVSASKKRSY